MKKIAVVGGDRRQRIVVEALRKRSYDVSTFALNGDDAVAATLAASLAGADGLILPVKADDEEGWIGVEPPFRSFRLTKKDLLCLKDDAPVWCGVASDHLRKIAADSGHRLYEVMDDDAVAVPNAALTAEAVLSFLMERSDTAIGGKRVAIFGSGRVAKACGRLFTALGCDVTLFCREEKDIAAADVCCDLRLYAGVNVVLPEAEVVINTVPARVVTAEYLAICSDDAVLIDLASAPGGFDPEAARILGREIIVLPGLPGKYAPRSAGEILAAYYLEKVAAGKGEHHDG